MVVQKYFRRYIVSTKIARLRYIQAMRVKIANFIYIMRYRYKQYLFKMRTAAVQTIQPVYRGYHARRWLIESGENERMQRRRNTYLLSFMVARAWRAFLKRRYYSRRICERRAPKDLTGWRQLLASMGTPPVRVNGFIEEHIFPHSARIYFYHHSVTGHCTFEKPRILAKADRRQIREKNQMFLNEGYTDAQDDLAIVLQTMWRGEWLVFLSVGGWLDFLSSLHVCLVSALSYVSISCALSTVILYIHSNCHMCHCACSCTGHKARKDFAVIESINELCRNSERVYLAAPNDLEALYNYALTAFVMLQDYDRARGLFLESMKRMERRGPDVPFVLYCYAIFATGNDIR